MSLSVDADRCNACGLCVEGCYMHAMTISGGKAVIDQDLCKGCARCAHSCPERAITLHMEDPDYIVGTVRTLSGLVDVWKEERTALFIGVPDGYFLYEGFRGPGRPLGPAGGDNAQVASS